MPEHEIVVDQERISYEGIFSVAEVYKIISGG